MDYLAKGRGKKCQKISTNYFFSHSQHDGAKEAVGKRQSVQPNNASRSSEIFPAIPTTFPTADDRREGEGKSRGGILVQTSKLPLEKREIMCSLFS